MCFLHLMPWKACCLRLKQTQVFCEVKKTAFTCYTWSNTGSKLDVFILVARGEKKKSLESKSREGVVLVVVVVVAAPALLHLGHSPHYTHICTCTFCRAEVFSSWNVMRSIANESVLSLSPGFYKLQLWHTKCCEGIQLGKCVALCKSIVGEPNITSCLHMAWYSRGLFSIFFLILLFAM